MHTLTRRLGTRDAASDVRRIALLLLLLFAIS